MKYRNGTKNDRWIVEHVFPGLRGAFFVEAGACDGIRGSSCYVLERHLGWTGICIEANDPDFAALPGNRPNSACENVALHHTTGEVVFLEAVGDRPRAYSGVAESIGRFRKDADQTRQSSKSVTKQSATLQDILCRNAAPCTIHFLAMDIEGSERPVLEVFPFDRWKFLAISIEGRRCDDLLLSAGYVKVQNPFNKDKPFEQYFVHPDALSLAWQLRRLVRTGRVVRRGMAEVNH